MNTRKWAGTSVASAQEWQTKDFARYEKMPLEIAGCSTFQAEQK